MSMKGELSPSRKERRTRQLVQPGVEEIEMVDWSPGPEAQALNTELKERLEGAISLLPEDQRVAVVLHDVQQLSNDEAAQVLDISVPAFKARLHRGRLALRKHLSDYVRASRA